MKASKPLWIASAIMALCAATVIVGCSQGPPAAPKGGTLTGVTWQLDMLNGSQAPAGPKPVTATFDPATMSGFAGVNSYSGSYIAGADGAFKTGPLAATQMAGGPEAMQLETGYLKALEASAKYMVTAGQLTLYGADGKPLIVYRAGK